MDEGDRPTDADESADRDERAEGESEGSDDGVPDGIEDERTERDSDVGPRNREGATDEPGAAGEEERESTVGGAESESGVEGAESESAGSPSPTPGALDPDAGADDALADVGGVRSDAEGNAADDRTRGEPASAGETDPETEESLLYRFRHDREGALMWIREMLTSVGVVLLVGLLLFGVSGVWPPMVAVESGSMEPNMQVGDLVFVTEPGQFAPDAADNDVGVVTHEVGETADYRTFGSYGSVVIYAPPGRSGSPIIHRAMFRVTEGENWYDRTDGRYHNAVDCESLAHCPAPHDGFVTLGDNNEAYDQASGLSPPVKAEWVSGVARARVPYLGYIRLIATGQVELNEAIARTIGSSLPPMSSTSAAAAADAAA